MYVKLHYRSFQSVAKKLLEKKDTLEEETEDITTGGQEKEGKEPLERDQGSKFNYGHLGNFKNTSPVVVVIQEEKEEVETVVKIETRAKPQLDVMEVSRRRTSTTDGNLTRVVEEEQCTVRGVKKVEEEDDEHKVVALSLNPPGSEVTLIFPKRPSLPLLQASVLRAVLGLVLSESPSSRARLWPVYSALTSHSASREARQKMRVQLQEGRPTSLLYQTVTNTLLQPHIFISGSADG